MNTNSKTKKKIALVKGGSRYSARSEEAAAHIKSKLLEAGVTAIDIHILSTDNYLHEGKERDPHAVLPYAHGAINLSYDKYNYNNLSQLFFSEYINKIDGIRLLSQLGITIPRTVILRSARSESLHTDLYNIWRSMHTPVIIKCNHEAYPALLTFNFQEALKYIQFLHSKSKDAVISEYADGDKFYITVLPNYRGESHYAPIPLHIIKPKYSINSQDEHVSLSSASHTNITEAVKAVSKDIHKRLGIASPATYEFVYNKHSLKLVNFKTKIDFHPDSKFSKSIASTGIHLGHLIDHYIN